YRYISTATAVVTVEDNVDPVAIAKDITVQLDANGTATITAADIDNGSNDACGIASLSLDISEFGCGDVGANTVTLTVTDNNGNVSTTTTKVTVEDRIKPIPGKETLSDIYAECEVIEAEVEMPTATDNCTGE